MSKLLKMYENLKKKESTCFYMFKSGMFYIFLDKDAQEISKILNLKLTKLNDLTVKCGFPINSLEKYSAILDNNNITYEIIDSNEIIVSKKEYISNQNISSQLETIKNLNIDSLTPIKAFELIAKLHSSLEEFEK